MKTDINLLIDQIMRMDDVNLEFTAEDRETLREIADWSMKEAGALFNEGLETEEAFMELSRRATGKYPELSEESLNDLLMYVYFYTFK